MLRTALQDGTDGLLLFEGSEYDVSVGSEIWSYLTIVDDPAPRTSLSGCAKMHAHSDVTATGWIPHSGKQVSCGINHQTKCWLVAEQSFTIASNYPKSAAGDNGCKLIEKPM